MLNRTHPFVLPRIPPWLRLAFAGGVFAFIFYVALFFESSPDDKRPTAAPEILVPVPSLDDALLDTVRDTTRDERLVLESQPFQHLLQVALDVVPSVAHALGMPDEPVPLAVVQEDPQRWHRRWLWYEGVVEDLTGPRDGHPVKGRSIYEATIRLADGQHVIAAFTIPPPDDVFRGSWARVEGFMLKLRDTTYPIEVQRAPLLVGRAIQRDYEDWAPVTSIDPQLLAKIDNSNFWPGSQTWQSVDDDQCEALWHLGAYARDTASTRTFADWRKFGTLNVHDTLPLLTANKVQPGQPIRLLGTLIRRTTIAAPANPAGIKHWTVAWMQVRDFGGHVIPVWVPKRVADLPERIDLEVRGFYYRWYVYETLDGTRLHVPLFIAADLDPFRLEIDGVASWLSGVLATFVIGCMGLAWWIQRRWAKSSLEHQRHLDARRRLRRERQAAASTNS